MTAIPDSHSQISAARASWVSPGRVRAAVLAAGALIAVGLLAGCSSSPPAATASAAASASPAATSTSASAAASSTTAMSQSMIHISSFKYAVPATVAPGSTVSVMNMDGENHTVTADSGKAFDVMAIAGKTVTFIAPKAPGRYPFHCAYHAEMHGVLIVK